MPAQIQVTWPVVHKDVLARMNIGCESFRGGGVRDAAKPGKRYSAVDQLASDVGRKLIQNSQRGEKKGEMINLLYTSMR